MAFSSMVSLLDNIDEKINISIIHNTKNLQQQIPRDPSKPFLGNPGLAVLHPLEHLWNLRGPKHTHPSRHDTCTNIRLEVDLATKWPIHFQHATRSLWTQQSKTEKQQTER